MERPEADVSEIFTLIKYAVLALLFLVIVIGAYTLMKAKSKKKPMDDVNWEKEQEKLLAAAAQKKAMRSAKEKGDAKEECKPEGGG